jgi:Flp pilus assembly pilin Flp
MQDMHHSPTDNSLTDNTAKSNTAKTNERGSTMVEYALLVALMSIGCIASIGAVSTSVEDTFLKVAQGVIEN